MKDDTAVYLGVDVGTSSIAVVLADGRGKILKTFSASNPSAGEPSADGRDEQDPEAIRAVTDRLVADAERHARKIRREIAGIGWTGQMHGLVAVDRSLEPLTPFVTWRDRRAAPPALGCGIMEDWRRRGVKGVHRALSIVGYLNARRTGRCTVDSTFRASMGSEERLRRFAEWIPELDENSMLGDNQAGVYAAERLRPGSTVINIGTSGQLSRLVGADENPTPTAGLETRPYPGGRTLVCRASRLGGAALAKLRGELGYSWKRLNEEAESDGRIASTVAAIVDDLAIGTDVRNVRSTVAVGNAVRGNPCLVRAIERRFGAKCTVPEVEEMAAWGAALFAVDRAFAKSSLIRTKRSIIAETLRHEIMLGKYPVNSRFPSEHALMRRFGVARATVTDALADLKRDGILRARAGSGSYVTPLARVKGSIGLIVPDRGRAEIFEPICAAIRREVLKLGYEVVSHDVFRGTPSSRKDEAVAFARKCAERHVAGVIMEPLELVPGKDETTEEILAALDALDIPTVMIDRDVPALSGRSAYDMVGVDNLRAGHRLGELVIRAGARRIAYLSFRDSAPTILRRRAGAAFASLEAGLGWDNDRAIEIAYGDAHALARIMRGKNAPDALVCANDRTASFAIRSLEAIGISVPDDVLVTGFDDVSFAARAKVPITTERQPCDAIGTVAIRTLVERILHRDMPPRQVLLATETVERASTDSRKFRVKAANRGKGKRK